MSRASLLILSLSSMVLFVLVASSAPRERVFPEHAPSAWPSPRHWRALSKAQANDPVELVFALKLRNLDKLQESFYLVSGPHLLTSRPLSSLLPLFSQISPFSDLLYIHTCDAS